MWSGRNKIWYIWQHNYAFSQCLLKRSTKDRNKCVHSFASNAGTKDNSHLSPLYRNTSAIVSNVSTFVQYLPTRPTFQCKCTYLPSGQICNQYKWHHLVAKYALCKWPHLQIWWPNLQLIHSSNCLAIFGIIFVTFENIWNGLGKLESSLTKNTLRCGEEWGLFGSTLFQNGLQQWNVSWKWNYIAIFQSKYFMNFFGWNLISFVNVNGLDNIAITHEYFLHSNVFSCHLTAQ